MDPIPPFTIGFGDATAADLHHMARCRARRGVVRGRVLGDSPGTARLMAENGPMNDETVRAIAAGILMGALAGVMLLRNVLTTEAQRDRRWILVVLAAVIVAAVAGIVVGSLLNPN